MHTLALFFRLWNWFSYRQLSAHRWRAVAVLLGIALGSAVFTSVRLAVDASVSSFTQSVDTVTGKADRVITRSDGRVPEWLVARLLKHPAVLAASPRLTTYVQAGTDDTDPILLIGIDPVLDRPLRSRQTEVRSSSPPFASWIDLMGRPGTLFAGSKLAQRLHLKAGDTLPLENVLRKETFQVLGVLPPEGLASAEGGFVAVTDIATFQEFSGHLGYVDTIAIILKPNTTAGDIEDIRTVLPDSVHMEPASESRESGKLMIRSYQLNLSVLSFVSLFVGMFLVYSLVSLHATSRRHELAVLRSIGASPSMLFFLFISEGAFLGLLGWIGAIPFSCIMVKYLIRLVSSTVTHLFVRVQVDRLILDPSEIFLSFLITVAVATLAALQPACQAMKVPPRESLLMLDVSPGRKSPTRLAALLGAILILIAWPLSELPPVRSIPLWAYFATFLLFSGFSLLSPHFLRIMGSCLPPLLRRVAGQPAYLGGRYVRDGGTRIAISVGALITAVALFVALVIMVHSFRGTVELWVDQTISGDLFVTPRMAVLNRYRDPLPENVVTDLLKLRTFTDIAPYRRLYLNEGKHPYLLEAIDIEAFSKHAAFLFLKGDAREIMPRLIRGEGVVVSEVFSNQTNITIGDTYSATAEGAKIELPVLGVFRDYRTQGGVVNYSLAHFQELTGDRGWSGARLHFRDRTHGPIETADRVRKQLINEWLPRRQAVDVTLGEDLRQGILRIFDETFAITSILLVIALMVAALGITTTLTVLVLERSRQFHTLIAVGAGRGQIRAMIFWEAILMVTAAELIGLACGGLLSLLLIFVINRQFFGWTFMVSVDWTALLVSFPLILATGLLAALPAGQMVFRRTSALVLRER